VAGSARAKAVVMRNARTDSRCTPSRSRLPLLAPDAPVVAWWHGAPPDRIFLRPAWESSPTVGSPMCRGADDRVAALRATGGRLRSGRHGPRVDPDHRLARRLGLCIRRLARGLPRRQWSIGDDADPFRAASCRLGSPRAFGFYIPVNKTGGAPDRPKVRITLCRRCRQSAPTRTTGGSSCIARGQQDSVAPFPERSLGELLAEGAAPTGRRTEVFAEALGGRQRP